MSNSYAISDGRHTPRQARVAPCRFCVFREAGHQHLLDVDALPLSRDERIKMRVNEKINKTLNPLTRR